MRIFLTVLLGLVVLGTAIRIGMESKDKPDTVKIIVNLMYMGIYILGIVFVWRM